MVQLKAKGIFMLGENGGRFIPYDKILTVAYDNRRGLLEVKPCANSVFVDSCDDTTWEILLQKMNGYTNIIFERS